jgi:hypothetical protein
MTEDALLAALADARRRKDQAARDMRLLLAFAREITTPRPYRLADLAQATGLSISGIRIAYTDCDIQHARQLIAGSPGGGYRQHIEAAVTTLLAAQARHLPGPAAMPAHR